MERKIALALTDITQATIISLVLCHTTSCEMESKMNLRIPGPTPLPPEVIAALQRPMIDHRSAEFSALTLRIVAALKELCGTTSDVLLLSSSGTGGLESALVNTLSPGDHVLALTAGTFGEKFAQMTRAFGAQVGQIDFAPGERIEPSRVAEALKANPHVCAVLVTHNETSTGCCTRCQRLRKSYAHTPMRC